MAEPLVDEHFLKEALAKDLLSQEEASAALVEAKKAGTPVSEVLVARGLMSPRTVAAVQRAASAGSAMTMLASSDAQTLAPKDEAPPASEPGPATMWSDAHPAALEDPAAHPPEADALTKPLRTPKPPQAADEVPATLGDYDLAERLGEGGMGAVYKATQRSLRREVAVKVLSSRATADKKASERFLREARVAAAVNHPNVITVFAVGDEDGRLYMAMELVRGGDASKLAREHPGAKLPERRALELLRDCARGLSAIERAGLVHRDIKPANIFVMDDGTAKLADLGLARPLEDDEKMTQSGFVVGTPAFMPPEQAQGEQLDVRADIYALGASLYELVTGRPPYLGSAMVVLGKLFNEAPPAPRSLNPQLSRPCADLIERAMARDRSERYQSAAELLEAVESALNGQRPARGAPPRAATPPEHAPGGRKLGASSGRGRALEPQPSAVDRSAPTVMAKPGPRPRVEESGGLPLPIVVMVGAAVLLLGGGLFMLGRSRPKPPTPPETAQLPGKTAPLAPVETPPTPTPSETEPTPEPEPEPTKPPVAGKDPLDFQVPLEPVGVVDVEGARPLKLALASRARGGATIWKQEGERVLVASDLDGALVEARGEPRAFPLRLTFDISQLELTRRRSSKISAAERQIGLSEGAPAMVYHLGVRQDGGDLSDPAGIRGAALWVTLFFENGPIRGCIYQSNEQKAPGQLVVSGGSTPGVELVESFRIDRFAPNKDDVALELTAARLGWSVILTVARKRVLAVASTWAETQGAPVERELKTPWTPWALVGNYLTGRGTGALAVSAQSIREDDLDLSPPRPVAEAEPEPGPAPTGQQPPPRQPSRPQQQPPQQPQPQPLPPPPPHGPPPPGGHPFPPPPPPRGG